jgi:8-oxo-dGTP diphosphatase
MTETLTDDRPTISAGIITQDGAVLLVLRKVKEGSLSWQFPAGEVEPGETPEEAAARETVEETGLTVSPVQLLGERIHPKTGRRMAYVACDVVSGTAHVADEDELADFAWVKPSEFSSFVPYGFAPVVEDYLADALALRE